MLFTKYIIKDFTLRNKIVMAPMCMFCAEDDGVATPWHIIHYGTRASGGAGLIIVEATAILPEGRISNNDLGLWNDHQEQQLSLIAKTIKENGALAGIQINHAGRKSRTKSIVAPSPIPYDNYPTPNELTIDEIKRIIAAFTKAAARANKAGFDFLEIHGAHGYLINQFLSPITNKRNDSYGGSEENRLRFLKETIEAILQEWPKDKILALRISAEEFVEGGLKPKDYGRFLKEFKNSIDFIDVSSGAIVNNQINVFPGYQLDFAREVKTLSSIPVIGGGLINDLDLANYALNSKACDLIYFGRKLLKEPYFPQNESNKQNIAIYPKQYNRSYQ